LKGLEKLKEAIESDRHSGRIKEIREAFKVYEESLETEAEKESSLYQKFRNYFRIII